MSNIGTRVLAAIAAAFANPDLVSRITVVEAENSAQSDSLNSISVATTGLAAKVAELESKLTEAGVLDAEQAAVLAELKAFADSLNAAFPEPAQVHPEVEPVAPEEPVVGAAAED